MAAPAVLGGSGWLQKICFGLAGFALLALLASPESLAQPRGGSTAGRAPAAAAPSGAQNEAVDLNEGKSAAELFQAGCAVCHQGVGGLAKGRRPNELVGFLRQHYTSSVQHAAVLAGYLAAAGEGRGGPTAAPRQAPMDRPPASIGRRGPADDDADQRRRPAEAARPQDPRQQDQRPQEASRPPEREAPAKRRPGEKPERPAAAAARAAQPPVAIQPDEPAAAPSEPAPAPATAPPVEEKPAAPEIPL